MVIRIPEGVKLPITATIQSSSSIEASMSSRDFPSEKNSQTRRTESTDGDTRRISRASTIPEASEPASPTPKRSISLKNVRRGVLNVSEAFVPLAQSSDIFARGEVFRPEHAKESNHQVCAKWTPRQESSEATTQPERWSPPEDSPTETPINTPVDPPAVKAVDSRPASNYSRTESTTSLERFSPAAIPAILIHAPPDTDQDMGALGTEVIKRVSGAPVTPRTVLHLVGAESRPPAPVADLPKPMTVVMPMNLPMNTVPLTQKRIPLTPIIPKPVPMDEPLLPVTPLQSPTHASPPATLLEVPAPALPHHGLPDAGLPPLNAWFPAPADRHHKRKGKKHHRAIKKARKMILRRKILGLILSRELAEIVLPKLNERESGGR